MRSAKIGPGLRSVMQERFHFLYPAKYTACSLLVPQKALHFLSFSTEVQDRNDLLAEHQFKQVRFMAIEDFVVLFAKSVYKVKISENTCLRGIFWCHKDSKSYNYISA